MVFADDLVDFFIKRAREIRLESKKGKLEKENEEIEEIIGLGALKYAMLRVGRLRDIHFDIEESVCSSEARSQRRKIGIWNLAAKY